MKKAFLLIAVLLITSEGYSQSWLTNWYDYINSTLINGPTAGGTKLYMGRLFDTVGSMISQYGGGTLVTGSIPGAIDYRSSTGLLLNATTLTYDSTNGMTFAKGAHGFRMSVDTIAGGMFVNG